MKPITYTVIPNLSSGVKVENNLGVISHFGDFYAFALFVQGAARSHQQGIPVTVIALNGEVMVGTVEQLDPVTA
jgi:hypothetical protein